MLNVAIEVGRGLASLWVFVFHLSGQIGAALPAVRDLAAAGHFGVPVFFVISGYCMMAVAMRVIRRGERSGTFLFWRFLRIYPPFWFSIVVVVLVPLILGVLGALRTGVLEIPPARWMELSLADWVRHVTLLQVFEARSVGMDHAFAALNIVYWTLAIEFQFYLVVWAGLILRTHFDRVMIAVTALAAVTACFPAAYQTGVFLPWWPMFALGLGLHRLLASGVSPQRVFGGNALLPASGLLLAILAADVAFLGYGPGARFHAAWPMASNFVQATVAAVCFWAAAPLDQYLGARERGALVKALVSPFLLLGAISYSLYLLHAKLYQVPFAFVRQVVTSDHFLSPLLTILGTIGLTYLFYLACERPFLRRYREGRGRRTQSLAAEVGPKATP